ncbi:MAG: bacteriohemerythrin [Ignavibacteriales bacterium]|nr:MAG: bacteriohemerythrin [Ignavibacteriales bacterium]
MALIAWNEKYSVGINSIDAQHKRLVDYTNQLHDAMASGKAKEKIPSILENLVRYTKDHFAYEEKVMDSNKYPGYLKQKMEHDSLTKQVTKFKDDMLAGKISLSIEVMEFLKGWLINHISGSDKLYTQFLVSKGVK